MTVIRWAPLRELTSWQREVDRLLDQVQEKWEYPDADFVPAAEMVTDDQQIVVNVELPGLTAQDIDIQVTAQTVTISGEKARPEAGTGQRRSEFRYGKFHRVINLPTKVQNDQVAAQYEQGILKLVLPKLTVDENKVVKVNIAS